MAGRLLRETRSLPQSFPTSAMEIGRSGVIVGMAVEWDQFRPHWRRVELPGHRNDCAAEAAPKNRCRGCERAAAAAVELTVAMDEGIDSYSDGSA
jgi:hypothetical protein